MSLDIKDIKINTYRFDTNIGVEIVHLQSGLKAYCEKYSSIHWNRQHAMLELERLVAEHNQEELQASLLDIGLYKIIKAEKTKESPNPETKKSKKSKKVKKVKKTSKNS